MGQLPQPIQKNTLVEMVVDALQQQIESGHLPPGSFLPPRKELARQFQVGMSTIQEATRALTAIGLLESRPGKGTWVREKAEQTLVPPSTIRVRLAALDARQLYDARSAVEVVLTEFAAARATEQDITAIFAALAAMEAAGDDNLAYAKADLKFHLAVAAAGHNDLLAEFYQLARGLFEQFITEIILIPGVKEEGIEIQRKIATRIKQHDVTGARQAALEHMAIIERLIEQWVEQR